MSRPDYPDTFENEVRECLTHMYDFAAMQSDPVVQRLAPGLTGLESIQTARKILIDTIEKLNQRDDPRIQSKQARLYHILLLRYVEEQPISGILQQLAISDRQYYRELQRAIGAVSQLLWQQFRQASTPPETISLETEIERASRLEGLVHTNLDELLANAVGAVNVLAANHDVRIEQRASTEKITANIPENVLKQAIIYILSELVKHMDAGGMITIEADTYTAQPVITLYATSEALEVTGAHLEPAQNVTIAQLLHVMDAELRIDSAQTHEMRIDLVLPRYERKLLIIDDNPDVSILIKRYLANTPYVVIDTQDPMHGLELAHKLQPFTIMLDIMMPEWDGWGILQDLKNHPQTRSIPVLICSVLDTPELALSLGADYYLKKPPDRVALLQILAQLG